MTLVAVGTGLCAAAVVMRAMPLMTRQQKELLVLYFQPFVPLGLMLALWGAAVAAWDAADVPWRACFDLKTRQAHMSATTACGAAVGLGALVAAAAAAFANATAVTNIHRQAVAAGAAHAVSPPPVSPTAVVAALYLAVPVCVLWPYDILNRAARRHFAATCARVFVAPLWCPRVTFSDFLLADILTSLAKSVADLERAMCHLVMTDRSDPLSRGMPVCGDVSWRVPLALAVPSLVRFAQCLRAHRDASLSRGLPMLRMTPDLWNAIKYTTALPVICLSYVHHHVTADEWAAAWRPLWLFAAIVNTAYSVYWDVTRDWELGAIHRVVDSRRLLLRHDLLYSRGFYYYLLVSNTVMRCAWTHKLSSHLRSRVLANMLAACIEAVRRFQWAFVRIEVELRKIHAGDRELVFERATGSGNFVSV